MKSIFIVLLLALGCSGTPKPTPHVPDDTASCTSACAKMQEMKCDEAKPLEDGTSCAQFCQDTQNSGHALRPSCIVSDSVKVCGDIQKCFK